MRVVGRNAHNPRKPFRPPVRENARKRRRKHAGDSLARRIAVPEGARRAESPCLSRKTVFTCVGRESGGGSEGSRRICFGFYSEIRTECAKRPPNRRPLVLYAGNAGNKNIATALWEKSAAAPRGQCAPKNGVGKAPTPPAQMGNFNGWKAWGLGDRDVSRRQTERAIFTAFPPLEFRGAAHLPRASSRRARQ